MKITTVKKAGDNYLVNGDTFVYSNSDDVRDQDEHKKVLAWIKKGGTVENEFTAEELQNNQAVKLGNNIREAIFREYAKDKQDEDKGWRTYWKNYIVGVSALTEGIEVVTTDALSVDIVGATIAINDSALTIEYFINSKPQVFQAGYIKLLKIALKTQWTKSMVDEWKLSLSEQREASYPPFPTFGGA